MVFSKRAACTSHARRCTIRSAAPIVTIVPTQQLAIRAIRYHAETEIRPHRITPRAQLPSVRNTSRSQTCTFDPIRSATPSAAEALRISGAPNPTDQRLSAFAAPHIDTSTFDERSCARSSNWLRVERIVHAGNKLPFSPCNVRSANDPGVSSCLVELRIRSRHELRSSIAPLAARLSIAPHGSTRRVSSPLRPQIGASADCPIDSASAHRLRVTRVTGIARVTRVTPIIEISRKIALPVASCARRELGAVFERAAVIDIARAALPTANRRRRDRDRDDFGGARCVFERATVNDPMMRIIDRTRQSSNRAILRKWMRNARSRGTSTAVMRTVRLRARSLSSSLRADSQSPI